MGSSSLFRILLSTLLIAFALGCGDSSTATNDGATDSDGSVSDGEDRGDGKADNGDGSTPPGDGSTNSPYTEVTGPLTWESEADFSTPVQGVVCKRVTYLSEGLTIEGTACRPAAAGKYPILMVNHGLNAYGQSYVANYASKGYAAFESAYRGEGMSDGEIEFCKGEIYDVRRMLQIAKTLDYVDTTRVGMIGFSHGGCVSMRVLLAEETLHPGSILAVSNVFGPADMADVHRLWANELNDITLFFLHPRLTQGIQDLEEQCGGKPDQVPAAYAERSPVTYAEEFKKFNTSIFIGHGVPDHIVPVSSNCRLASDIGGFDAWHFGFGDVITASAPVNCGFPGLAWKGGAAPTSTFPAKRTIMIFDYADHDTGTLQGPLMLARANAHIDDKLSP
ncbi:MAG: CocE/NonD family hydrolase [Polyangiales bacterium]